MGVARCSCIDIVILDIRICKYTCRRLFIVGVPKAGWLVYLSNVKQIYILEKECMLAPRTDLLLSHPLRDTAPSPALPRSRTTRTNILCIIQRRLNRPSSAKPLLLLRSRPFIASSTRGPALTFPGVRRTSRCSSLRFPDVRTTPSPLLTRNIVTTTHSAVEATYTHTPTLAVLWHITIQLLLGPRRQCSKVVVLRFEDLSPRALARRVGG